MFGKLHFANSIIPERRDENPALITNFMNHLWEKFFRANSGGVPNIQKKMTAQAEEPEYIFSHSSN